MQGAQSDLRKHRSGLAYLSALLQKAKSEIARDGYISEEIRTKIFHASYFWDYYLRFSCATLFVPRSKNEDRPSEKVVDEQTDIENAPFRRRLY